MQHTTSKLEAREVDLARVSGDLHRESSALQSQTSRAQELQDELALMSSQLEAIRTRNFGLEQAMQGDMAAKEGLRASLDEANFTNHEMVRQISQLKENVERETYAPSRKTLTAARRNFLRAPLQIRLCRERFRMKEKV